MKTKTLLLLTFSVFLTKNTFGQGGLLGNNRPVLAPPLGWTSGTPGSLEIRNNFTQPINFFTAATQRMTIRPTGFVGIGTNFTAPANLLHVSAGTNAGYAQITNNTTGNTVADGFRFGVASSGRAEVRQAESLPMDFFTNNAHRMAINGTTGYIGISPVGYFVDSVPRSMIHMYEPSSGAGPTMGWRDWMRTGVFMDRQGDAMYAGMRDEPGVQNSAVIAWSDDAGGGTVADRLRFIHTTAAPTNPLPPVNPLTGTSRFGYEFMQMMPVGPLNSAGFPSGHIGIGPVFTDTDVPRNRLHMNAEDAMPVYMQISNQNGTGQLGTDGLKLGLQALTTPAGTFQAGHLQWQENTPFLIQTDWDPNSGGVTGGERLRVTSVGALTNTEGSTYGGLTTPANRTRIAISADGSNPVTRPLSLLHLGFNTGTTFPGTDGWRPWMDLGTFTSNGSDNVYIGLKQETSFINDRYDAVLSWGDNPVAVGGFPTGPDNFRMIFTSNTNPVAGGTPPATGVNGLEAMRMTPTDINGVFTGMGGDPGVNMYGPGGTSVNPTATLEVNSWGLATTIGGSSGLRFTDLNSTTPTIANPGTGVLSVNADGDVIYVPGGGGSGVATAENGVSVNATSGAVVLGQDLNQPGNPAKLLSTREIPLNDNNLVFTDASTTNSSANFIGIGVSTPTARLHIQTSNSTQVSTPTGLKIENYQNGTNNAAFGADVRVQNPANSGQVGALIRVSEATFSNIGVNSVASDGSNAIGVFGQGQDGTLTNRGLDGTATATAGNEFISAENIGVRGTATRGKKNFGGYFEAQGSPGYTPLENTGLFNSVAGPGNTNIGLVCQVAGATTNVGLRVSVSGSGTNYAGQFFGGDVYVGGYVVLTSDANLKENVVELQNAADILSQLNPISFDFKQDGTYGRMNLPDAHQYGLIAQEVETVIPELVQENFFPAEFDSLGNETASAIPFKTLNYDGIIPFLIAGHQEQQAQIDSLSATTGNGCCDSLATVVANQQDEIDVLNTENDQQDATIAQLSTENDALEAENEQQQQTIDDLNSRLSNLENCLFGILPTLCQLSHSMIQENNPEAQELVRQQLSVVLSNRNAIILDQNVPNPFAEQTVINFSIPETVVKAQILFYSLEGKLMQSVDVNERGLGSLTVFGSDLSSGTYTYTLVADGKVVATKKMMKQ